ncbi:arsenate reductase (glutaredoxin) [Nitriliruptoraceae bacterium ZYF776]|nr:arsenate reductase (glutaredoxin) [Profundirhabdus halotolerans]
MTTTVWHNPRCSKSRKALALLDERDVEVEIRRYLDDPPSRDELVTLLEQLGVSDLRDVLRTGERVYRELELGEADDAALFDAVVAHPILLERPIVVHDGEAVVGRPPENVLSLLGP